MTETAETSVTIDPSRLIERAEPPGESAVGIRLELQGVERRYGQITAVNGVHLAVRQGELLALLGPSGCGKTTTLRLIAGFEAPDAGSITIAGQRVADRSTLMPPERRKVGMVFQDYALFPHLSVAENVAFGVRKAPDRARIVADALALVGLTGLENRMPSQLSGGQQQRVALARALAPRPDLVLLDEPFSNLDPHLRSQVRDEVRAILRRAGATAVLVTHDQEEALTLTDRVAVMFDGRVAQCESPEVVYHRPADRAVAEFIGDAQFLPGQAAGDTVETAIGVLPLARERHGPVDVLIRPEMVDLKMGSGPGRAQGIVVERRFAGRDLSIVVRLESGDYLTARVFNHQPLQAGDDISVAVTGPVIAFPV
jgi:iron(III) transport system ATP-binding protein